MEPVKTGKKQDTKFKPGQSGNPNGRPPGTISIVARIKQKFEQDPVYFEEWLSKLMEDPTNRRAIMEQIDGKPKQVIAGDSENPLRIEISEQVAKKNGLT